MQLRNPPLYACPRGYQCPPGSKYPTLCHPGTLAPGVGSPVCDLVLAGHYANATGLVSLGADISYIACNQSAKFANLIITQNETKRSFSGDFPETGDFPICQVRTVNVFGRCKVRHHFFFHCIHLISSGTSNLYLCRRLLCLHVHSVV